MSENTHQEALSALDRLEEELVGREQRAAQVMSDGGAREKPARQPDLAEQLRKHLDGRWQSFDVGRWM
jgi:hypothetical protein